MGLGSILEFDILEIGQHLQIISQRLYIQRVAEHFPTVALCLRYTVQCQQAGDIGSVPFGIPTANICTDQHVQRVLGARGIGQDLRNLGSDARTGQILRGILCDIAINITLRGCNVLQAHFHQPRLLIRSEIPTRTAQITQELKRGMVLGILRWRALMRDHQGLEVFKTFIPQSRGQQTDDPVKFAIPIVAYCVPHAHRQILRLQPRLWCDLRKLGQSRAKHVAYVAPAVIDTLVNRRRDLNELPQ